MKKRKNHCQNHSINWGKNNYCTFMTVYNIFGGVQPLTVLRALIDIGMVIRIKSRVYREGRGGDRPQIHTFPILTIYPHKTNAPPLYTIFKMHQFSFTFVNIKFPIWSYTLSYTLKYLNFSNFVFWNKWEKCPGTSSQCNFWKVRCPFNKDRNIKAYSIRQMAHW